MLREKTSLSSSFIIIRRLMLSQLLTFSYSSKRSVQIIHFTWGSFKINFSLNILFFLELHRFPEYEPCEIKYHFFLQIVAVVETSGMTGHIYSISRIWIKSYFFKPHIFFKKLTLLHYCNTRVDITRTFFICLPIAQIEFQRKTHRIGWFLRQRCTALFERPQKIRFGLQQCCCSGHR